MEDTLTKVGLLVLGWLFGLLSPAIVESIRRARDVKPMMESIADELHEFRYTTACTASVLWTHLGKETTDSYRWFKSVVDDYKGVQEDPRLKEAMTTFASLSEEQVNALNEHRKARGSQALGVKELRVPALDARVPTLWMLPRRAQSELLQLLSDVHIYNQEMQNAEHFRKLTFQKLENGNHELATEALRRSYGHQASIAQRLADQAARCERGLRTANWGK